jgi:hypothetical protein
LVNNGHKLELKRFEWEQKRRSNEMVECSFSPKAGEPTSVKDKKVNIKQLSKRLYSQQLDGWQCPGRTAEDIEILKEGHHITFHPNVARI